MVRVTGWRPGPAGVSSLELAPGVRASVERALSRWMIEEALLQPKRHYPDRTSWEPKAGALASIQRALSGKRRATGQPDTFLFAGQHDIVDFGIFNAAAD